MRSSLALFLFAIVVPVASAQSLQTVAEKSDYRATSRYADVVAFCETVAQRGPIAKLSYFGTSHEGRKLPLLTIADPPVATPEDARDKKKTVVLAFANIHAGEVDGKEALLALARDLTDKPGHPLLKDLVILLVPILNADGNERIDPKNRPGDKGPVAGAGIRENAQEFDLNRDFVKLEIARNPARWSSSSTPGTPPSSSTVTPPTAASTGTRSPTTVRATNSRPRRAGRWRRSSPWWPRR